MDPDEDERCVVNGFPYSQFLLRADVREWVGWMFKVEGAERCHTKSRFKKLASTIAFRGAVVDRHLADDFKA
jgi:hypothetical protein